MKRDVYVNLLKWKHSKNRMPLIIKGARQVGKTYIVKQFAKNEYKNIAYINFEQDPYLVNIFEENLKPSRIIEKISIYLEKKVLPLETLIFFDEIQECPKALTSLKYFSEEAENFHVIAAGSLLGIKFSQNFSFPVGKVNFLNMFPMTFIEFLSGMGYELLAKELASKKNFNSIENPFHEKLNYYLKLYFLIGGMPAAINKFKNSRDIKKVRKYQQSLLKSFEFDFSKHTSKQDAIKITNVWNTIPKILAKENKKFTYSEISKHSRARDYYGAIRWLLDSGLIYQSYRMKVLKLPAKAYLDNNIFKLYFLDIGLLGALLEISGKIILESNKLFQEYNGAFTENYIAEELSALGFSDLFYWASKNFAEVDFVIPFGDSFFPLEVKSGASKKKKSLKVLGEKYTSLALSRTTMMNFKKDGKIYNFPLYGISLFPKLITRS